MATKRQVVIWLILALSTTALLAGVLVWQNHYSQTRWSIFMVGDPHLGAKLFFEREGCAHCHSVNGVGGKQAPDLGYSRQAPVGLNELVTTMWNHTPRMWDRMRAEKIAYPDLSYEETAHLFAFLYTARYVDERGDEFKGSKLFESKGCARCHALRGVPARLEGAVGPDLSSAVGLDTPVRWTQAMWNHASSMQENTERLHLAWPRFEGREMNDLLAYIRANSASPRTESELLPASPERGWKVFQSKSCIECHAVHGKGGRVGPEVGPGSEFPLSIVQFAQTMWNHSPDMWRELKARSIPRPVFEGQEIADLVAFLSSLRYFEPAGSPQVGQTVFAERGCGRCHGAEAQGGRSGPALRGRGQPTTMITLAAALWQHGPRMYSRARQLGQPWPTLEANDVGDLVAFLNAPTGGGR